MTLKMLFVYNVVVTLPFGVALVLAPVPLISLYGVALGREQSVVAQLFGSALVFVGLLCWFARNSQESEARRAIVLASFLECSLGFVIALLAQVSGKLNPLGWSNVFLYLSFSVGYGYFHFVRRREEST